MTDLRGIRPIAALDDRLRQRIYLFARARRTAITREDVAGELGISRKLAAFHLDKLLDRGLLRVHYARPAGRSGPGAGRTSKMYEPSDLEVDVSIPARRYDLVGELLVDAIEAEAPGAPARETATRVARDRGFEIGRRVRTVEGLGRPGPERAFTAALGVLEEHGFEPYREGERVRVRNCPFHALAQRAPDLVCEMNRSFVDGMLRGLGNQNVEAVIERRPGECCVELRRAETR
ncbi:MAG: helix-turn-helix transcriptional regulator [Actinomycetota bacterium]